MFLCKYTPKILYKIFKNLYLTVIYHFLINFEASLYFFQMIKKNWNQIHLEECFMN
jgi:hypothetical protein